MSVFVAGAGVIPNTLLQKGYVQLEYIESTGTQYINTGIIPTDETKGENFIHDFVPCKNSSNEIGLYDTINKVFYSNAGSGSFVAGTEL